jgi:phage-related tail protein
MILNDFVLEIEREKTRIHLKEEQKQLSQLERDLRKLKAANDRYYREIEMAKERILRMEENIIKNEAEQIEAVERIGQQQEVVKTVKSDLDRIN